MYKRLSSYAWNFATELCQRATPLYASGQLTSTRYITMPHCTGGATPDTVSNYDTTVQIANNGFTKPATASPAGTLPLTVQVHIRPGANFHSL
ncbi:hypothetical protein GWK75_01535 [Candidatus Saccharibacteria bacterium oral taxon 955]|nr:hypothetical protein GWK75_01535 [Candidatus Saccharibacteria bacterium oral taxon 955]